MAANEPKIYGLIKKEGVVDKLKSVVLDAPTSEIHREMPVLS